MRLVDPDSPSWELSFDLSEVAHVALYVRDVLGLSVDQEIPPLEPALPATVDPLPDYFLTAAAIGWTAWWEEIMMTPTREIPPHRPELEAPMWDQVDAIAEAGRQWFYAQREPWLTPQSSEVWEISRAAVEDAAFDLGVQPAALHADTQLLLVQGRWWTHPAPGRLIYSPAIRQDPVYLHGLLRDTFAASLG